MHYFWKILEFLRFFLHVILSIFPENIRILKMRIISHRFIFFCIGIRHIFFARISTNLWAFVRVFKQYFKPCPVFIRLFLSLGNFPPYNCCFAHKSIFSLFHTLLLRLVLFPTLSSCSSLGKRTFVNRYRQ